MASLTGKKHSHVVDKIKQVLSEAEISARDFADIDVVRGREVTVYNLPKRECDLVISGYSVKYRLAIIDRWRELEDTVKAVSVEDMLLLAHKKLKQHYHHLHHTRSHTVVKTWRSGLHWDGRYGQWWMQVMPEWDSLNRK
jgi:phage regulator Rha-like protein